MPSSDTRNDNKNNEKITSTASDSNLWSLLILVLVSAVAVFVCCVCCACAIKKHKVQSSDEMLQMSVMTTVDDAVP